MSGRVSNLGGGTEGSSAVQPLWADRMKPVGTGRSAPQADQRACAVLHGTSGWCRASRGSPSKRRMDVVPPTTAGRGGAGGEGRVEGQVSYTLKDILSLNTNRNPVPGCFYFSKLLLEQLDCSLYLTVLLFHVRQKACQGIWGLVKGLEGSKAAKGGM